MAAKLNKTDRAKYDRLMKKFKLDPDGFDRNGSWLTQLDEFAHTMDEKYGEPMREIKGFNKGGTMKKKGYAAGGLKMVEKAYAKGGKVAMYNQGGMVKSTGTMNTGVKTAKNTYK